MVKLMRFIRWITGLPVGYGLVVGINWVNAQFIKWLYPWLPYDTLWRIEVLLVGSFFAIYWGLFFAYFLLPSDKMALINNRKVKVLFYVLSLWSIPQLVLLGSGLFVLFTDSYKGIAFDILAPVCNMIAILYSYGIFKDADFRSNEATRSQYVAHFKDTESRKVVDV